MATDEVYSKAGADAQFATLVQLRAETLRAEAAEGTAGAGALQKANNLGDLTNPTAARANLGIVDAAAVVDNGDGTFTIDPAGLIGYTKPGADAKFVLAAALTSEATTRANADTTNATAISSEATRATAAEALLAPKASPIFTGTPTAPTPAPLDNSTKLSTTAYVDAAVAVETARAQNAESRNSELAYSIDSSGVTLAVGVATYATINTVGLVIEPPSNPNAIVWIDFEATIGIINGSDTAGAGLFELALFDFTGGANTLLRQAFVERPAAGVALYDGFGQRIAGTYRLGKVTTAKTLGLKTELFRDSGSSLSAHVLNNTLYPTTMVAVAR